MERKLASIQVICEITDIPDSDNIVLAKINGWRCVIAKSYGLQVGDKCVYFEIDSKLPNIEVFKFMESSKFIVKTKKIRGVLSQGLIMPINMFPTINVDCAEDTDVTELLDVKHKDEFADCSLGSSRQPTMPKYVKKTDCERIQNIKYMLDDNYYVTEKLDGSSATFGYTKDKFVICSRRMDLSESYIYGDSKNTLWHKAADNYDLMNKLKDYPDLMFQGEIIGPGIQQNKYGLKNIQLHIFRIHDLAKDTFLGMQDMIDLCTKLELLHVPIIYDNIKYDSKTKDEWLKEADGKSALRNVDREGLVLAPIASVDIDKYYSIKVISNIFLLKQK